MFLDMPIEFFLKDVRAHLEGKEPVFDQSISNLETAHDLGLMVQEITDPVFRKTVISLIKRHNEVSAKNSTQI